MSTFSLFVLVHSYRIFFFHFFSWYHFILTFAYLLSFKFNLVCEFNSQATFLISFIKSIVRIIFDKMEILYQLNFHNFFFSLSLLYLFLSLYTHALSHSFLCNLRFSVLSSAPQRMN